MSDVTFICACSDLGVDIDGSDKGPIKLLEHFNNYKYSIIEKNHCIKSKVHSDLRKNISDVNQFNERLFNDVRDNIRNGCFPITLGGDHSISIGSALASQFVNGNLGIIWIDAHLDYNTFDTTITGNLHGLPLAAINGLCSDLTNFTSNFINPKNTVVVGYRSTEKNRNIEINNIISNGGTIFTDSDIKKYGIRSIMEKAFKIALDGTNGVHVSFDLDVVDPNICPGVSVAEVGGIDYDDINVINDFMQCNNIFIKSFDLVEFNPINDKDNMTYDIACNILEKFINQKK